MTFNSALFFPECSVAARDASWGITPSDECLSSSPHLALKLFWVAAITAESRCQGCSQGWEQQRGRPGETGKVLPGVRRVITSTMASLINDEHSAQSGQLSAEIRRIYIFHCSVPHEVSIHAAISRSVAPCEHTRK